jgi:alkylhydroperoxidase family enzyme
VTPMTTAGRAAETTQAVLDRVLADLPAVAADLDAAHRAAWDSLDPALIELTRLRTAMMLGNAAELAARTPGAQVDEQTIAELSLWPTSPRFGERERACLTYLEQHLIDVANVSAEQTEAVAAHLGHGGLASYASVVLVLEQRQRLRLAWDHLFATQEQP